MSAYINYLLNHAKWLIGLLILVAVFLISQISQFELDASSDSLVLENDKALRYYQDVMRNYGGNEYLIISYTAKNDALSAQQLGDLKTLTDKLLKLAEVKTVTSILDVPLFKSPPLGLVELGQKQINLKKGNADIALAKKELMTSPLYGNNLMSLDGKTSAILLTLKGDEATKENRLKRDDLRIKKGNKPLSEKEQIALKQLETQVRLDTKNKNERQQKTITAVRAIMAEHRQQAGLFLGGLPMIVADVIRFISNDLVVFSISVILMMALVLSVIFKTVRWVLVPLSISLFVAVLMTGLLSFLGWRVTVISSNYFSMLLVMTLSIIIHLVVKYRELNQQNPNTYETTLKETIITMAKPCLFTTLTTLIAFVSLLISGIRPVIDFGLMMAVGVTMALVISFILFPVMQHWLPKRASKPYKANQSITTLLAKFTDKKAPLLVAIVVFAVAISIIGTMRLSVDNRFVDYFKKDTEIYQGLSLIDNKLGGTTPLEVIIDGVGNDYWQDDFLRQDIHKVHQYLDSLPETGKVLSIDTLVQILNSANKDKPISNFFLNIARNSLPADVSEQVLRPYISDETDQIRIVVRIKETNKDLERQVLLDKINDHIVNKIGFKQENIHLTGMVVLFNNMLQSLFDSQIKTMGVVFVMIFIMFIIVFRSFYLALLAIIPNMLPSFLVLGIMGIFGIALDLMTITIAAIAIGIGVDNAIHYIYRFKKEFKQDGDYVQSMYRTHQSTGLAMFYTSMVISFGFLTLVLSNFIPSIYFGVFTALAMIAALFANLTLLPKLIIWCRPKI